MQIQKRNGVSAGNGARCAGGKQRGGQIDLVRQTEIVRFAPKKQGRVKKEGEKGRQKPVFIVY